MNSIIFYHLTAGSVLADKVETDQPESTRAFKYLSEKINTEYILLKILPGEVAFEAFQINRWLSFARESRASLCYSNYIRAQENTIYPHTTIPYQTGSIRDDFHFGPLVLVRSDLIKSYLKTPSTSYQYAGWYDLRLFLSRKGKIVHYPAEPCLYKEMDQRNQGQKQFDYVDPRNRDRQIEMEKAATNHLHEIGALVMPPFKTVDFLKSPFRNEVSVIIPVLNRERTIADAIGSVLKQQTRFPYNLIIIDNHSNDGTTEIIQRFNDDRIIHIIPDENNLGIGGCWNLGINHPECGRFSVQLDSDDLYADQYTLQQIVDKFYSEKCAMVIGSYCMVNFDLKEIPPGLIDHREWTDENGPNNALRINGLGAPRAFYTPVIRKTGFPDVSYGEDYAVGLAISREYKIGRIFDPIYLCRRWEDNTDANRDPKKVNAHNEYKDQIRSNEMEVRKRG